MKIRPIYNKWNKFCEFKQIFEKFSPLIDNHKAKLSDTSYEKSFPSCETFLLVHSFIVCNFVVAISEGSPCKLHYVYYSAILLLSWPQGGRGRRKKQLSYLFWPKIMAFFGQALNHFF